MTEDDSDRPIRRTGLSGAYPDIARTQERNLLTFKAHWDRIRNVETAAKQRDERLELESEERDDRIEVESKERDARLAFESVQRDDRLERNVSLLASTVQNLTIKVTTLETKIAMFAALGGIVGAVVGSIVTALILHFLIKPK